MNDINDKYARFALTEDARQRLVQLAQLQKLANDTAQRIVVETVIIQHGNRTGFQREERGG